MPIFLNIAQISTGFIEIPGRISLNIYVQGCEKRCPGCQNPELQPFEGNKGVLTVNDIDNLLLMYPMCDSVCWLGGDAVYQPVAFKELNKEFSKRGLLICLYTGKLLEEVIDLLDDVDIVIDGEWNGVPVTQSNCMSMWEPGSTNQRICVKTSLFTNPCVGNQKLDLPWTLLDWTMFTCVVSDLKKNK